MEEQDDFLAAFAKELESSSENGADLCEDALSEAEENDLLDLGNFGDYELSIDDNDDSIGVASPTRDKKVFDRNLPETVANRSSKSENKEETPKIDFSNSSASGKPVVGMVAPLVINTVGGMEENDNTLKSESSISEFSDGTLSSSLSSETTRIVDNIIFDDGEDATSNESSTHKYASKVKILDEVFSSNESNISPEVSDGNATNELQNDNASNDTMSGSYEIKEEGHAISTIISSQRHKSYRPLNHPLSGHQRYNNNRAPPPLMVTSQQPLYTTPVNVAQEPIPIIHSSMDSSSLQNWQDQTMGMQNLPPPPPGISQMQLPPPQPLPNRYIAPPPSQPPIQQLPLPPPQQPPIQQLSLPPPNQPPLQQLSLPPPPTRMILRHPPPINPNEPPRRILVPYQGGPPPRIVHCVENRTPLPHPLPPPPQMPGQPRQFVTIRNAAVPPPPFLQRPQLIIRSIGPPRPGHPLPLPPSRFVVDSTVPPPTQRMQAPRQQPVQITSQLQPQFVIRSAPFPPMQQCRFPTTSLPQQFTPQMMQRFNTSQPVPQMYQSTSSTPSAYYSSVQPDPPGLSSREANILRKPLDKDLEMMLIKAKEMESESYLNPKRRRSPDRHVSRKEYDDRRDSDRRHPRRSRRTPSRSRSHSRDRYRLKKSRRSTPSPRRDGSRHRRHDGYREHRSRRDEHNVPDEQPLEDEEMREYKRKLEEQRIARENLLKLKEQRRLGLVPSDTPLTPNEIKLGAEKEEGTSTKNPKRAVIDNIASLPEDCRDGIIILTNIPAEVKCIRQAVVSKGTRIPLHKRFKDYIQIPDEEKLDEKTRELNRRALEALEENPGILKKFKILAHFNKVKSAAQPKIVKRPF